MDHRAPRPGPAASALALPGGRSRRRAAPSAIPGRGEAADCGCWERRRSTVPSLEVDREGCPDVTRRGAGWPPAAGRLTMATSRSVSSIIDCGPDGAGYGGRRQEDTRCSDVQAGRPGRSESSCPCPVVTGAPTSARTTRRPSASRWGSRCSPPARAPRGTSTRRRRRPSTALAGRGRIVTPEGSAEIEAGVTVWVGVGTPHATESDGPEPLELVCFFSPPVVPGSYEKGPRP